MARPRGNFSLFFYDKYDMTFNEQTMASKGQAARSASGAAMSKYDVEVEARLKALEEQAHVPCTSGDGAAKVEASDLPSLPPRKTSNLFERVKGLEDRLEALIEKLS